MLAACRSPAGLLGPPGQVGRPSGRRTGWPSYSMVATLAFPPTTSTSRPASSIARLHRAQLNSSELKESCRVALSANRGTPELAPQMERNGRTSSLCLARTSTQNPSSFVAALQSKSVFPFFRLLLLLDSGNNNNLASSNPNAIPSASCLLIPARISSKMARETARHVTKSPSRRLVCSARLWADLDLAASTIRVEQRPIRTQLALDSRQIVAR